MTNTDLKSVLDSRPSAGPSPQLDTQETTVHPGPAGSYRTFLISGCLPAVEFARRVYAATDDSGKGTALLAFDACRIDAWFVRHRETHEIRVASHRCNLRWCPLCIRTRRHVLTNSVMAWLKDLDRPKFLTFTLRHSPAPLSDQIDALYGFFREFRRRPWFKKLCRGGIWFFQITWNQERSEWHPHLHVLADSKYIRHQQLSAKWAETTHGSPVVDIRAVTSHKSAAQYVARYATAPAKLDSLEFDRACDLVRALKGRRIVGSWGTAKGVPLAPHKCKDADDWEPIGGFWAVWASKWFSMDAAAIWSSWVDHRPCDVVIHKPPPDPPPPEILQEKPFSYKDYQLTFFGE